MAPGRSLSRCSLPERVFRSTIFPIPRAFPSQFYNGWKSRARAGQYAACSHDFVGDLYSRFYQESGYEKEGNETRQSASIHVDTRTASGTVFFQQPSVHAINAKTKNPIRTRRYISSRRSDSDLQRRNEKERRKKSSRCNGRNVERIDTLGEVVATVQEKEKQNAIVFSRSSSISMLIATIARSSDGIIDDQPWKRYHFHSTSIFLKIETLHLYFGMF